MKPNLTKQMKKWSFMTAGILLLAGTGVSCTSTEVIQPDSPADSKIISISVSNPDAVPGTKAEGAHEGMKLRYTAKLFKGEQPGASNFRARQEMLATEASSKPFTFEVTETGKFCVAIFADYIREKDSANDNGYYPDWHFDTSTDNDAVEMLGLRAEASDKMNASEFLNNDNFDCFYCFHPFEKTANAYDGQVTLKRAICKIRVCGTGGNIDNIESVTLKKLIYLSEFSFYNGWGAGPKTVSDKAALPEAFIPNKGSDNEFFYYYSFGSSNGNTDNNQNISFEFSIKGKEGYTFNDVVANSISNTKKNNIYKITGEFLKPTNSPSNIITINVTNIEEDWGETVEK